MKKVLLMVAAGLFVATGVMAQVDVSPKNWSFDKLAKGSADGLFIRESSAIGGNFKGDDALGKGFRWADNLEGGFSVANWTGAGDIAYKDMTADQKANLEAFYHAFQIVDGGKLGNIMIYQGNASTATDARAVKNAESMSAPNVYVVSQKDLPIGMYRISIPMRVFLNEDITNTVDINCYFGTAWWDNKPFLGGTNTDGNFHLSAIKDFNSYWTNYQFEVEITSNSAADYDFTPLLIKLGLGGTIANQSILMFDDLKIERITEATLGGQLKIDAVDWTDAPTGISYTKYEDNVIVFANDNGISVIDATAPIEVYTVAGQLIEKVFPNATVTTIPVNERGAYIVKTGDMTRKVIY